MSPGLVDGTDQRLKKSHAAPDQPDQRDQANLPARVHYTPDCGVNGLLYPHVYRQIFIEIIHDIIERHLFGRLLAHETRRHVGAQRHQQQQQGNERKKGVIRERRRPDRAVNLGKVEARGFDPTPERGNRLGRGTLRRKPVRHRGDSDSRGRVACKLLSHRGDSSEPGQRPFLTFCSTGRSTWPPNPLRIAESIFSANVCSCRERNRV